MSVENLKSYREIEMRIGDSVKNIHTGIVSVIMKIERIKRGPNDYIRVFELNDGGRWDSVEFNLHFVLCNDTIQGE